MEYLLIAVVVGAVGVGFLLWRQRVHTPRSVDDSINRFASARRALAPDARPRTTWAAAGAIRHDQRRRRVVPVQQLSDDRDLRVHRAPEK